MDEDRRPRGRCLCGAVAYAARGGLRPVINCHCERCRRFTGHHMAATSAEAADLELEGAEHIRWFAVPGAEYGSCRTCGSSLFWRSDETPEVWSICAGTLDPPTHLTTVEAWWVSHASDYATRPDLPERATE